MTRWHRWNGRTTAVTSESNEEKSQTHKIYSRRKLGLAKNVRGKFSSHRTTIWKMMKNRFIVRWRRQGWWQRRGTFAWITNVERQRRRSREKKGREVSDEWVMADVRILCLCARQFGHRDWHEHNKSCLLTFRAFGHRQHFSIFISVFLAPASSMPAVHVWNWHGWTHATDAS